MPPFADSLDKDEYVPMAGNPPSESLASNQEAASLYHEDIIPESTRDDLLSVMPGSSFPADAFCKTAETIFIVPSHESIVPRDLITSYFEAECDVSKLEILEDIMNFFQDPSPGKRRETFIVSPFNDRINFLVRYSAHSHERSLTILGTSDVIRNVPAWLVQLIDTIFCIMRLRVPSFEPKVFSWFLDQQRLGLTLIAQLGRFVHLGTDPSDIQSLSMFPAIEDIRNDGFWDFAGAGSRSQLHGGRLGFVGCSESMGEGDLADDESQGAQAQPRSRARSRSPPFLRRSSRLKRRRVDYSEGSDIDIDLRAKSSSHEDKDGLYSDIEQESDQSYGAQTDTAEFSSQEDSVPDAYAKAPVKAKATPVIPTFTEADLIFPLTQPDDLKLAVLFAASIQVTQLQTLVYYSCKEASYCLATAVIDWVSVSIVAEGLAPSDLKGLYAPEVCSQLYESDEHAEFRRKALLGPNWERLRGISSFEGMQPQEGDLFGLNDVDSGTCGRCRAFIHRLAEHEPSCVGRCLACVKSNSPCVRPVGKKTCVTCPTPQKCRDPSHEYRANPKGSEQCYMCLQFVGNIYSHVRECRGRCQNCIARKVPCTRGNFAGNHKCKDCNAEDQDCGNFSHDRRGTCKKCKAPVHDMRTHRPYCQGQCGACKEAWIPCVSSRFAKICEECNRLGKGPCKDYSHPIVRRKPQNLRARKRK
ncbi:uncharacterized protein FFB20_03662 [Fusarium fujikuroi]|nr:uncharacterized protein LW94_15161 [Fusarium fujikuroi]KLP11133.1 uncharacterized protein Y057_5916 [Fusarium fujikuroi]QGI58295.1 hypothetical protein CEK27_000420 [Fusarium fujikuroi]SCN70060.1 uncharacterized protein FFB20_03662 [Fusarium fujikuroi]SCN73315.1 uncharacterized protein FFC1_01743 [Fusarium fujikuroi]